MLTFMYVLLISCNTKKTDKEVYFKGFEDFYLKHFFIDTSLYKLHIPKSIYQKFNSKLNTTCVFLIDGNCSLCSSSLRVIDSIGIEMNKIKKINFVVYLSTNDFFYLKFLFKNRINLYKHIIYVDNGTIIKQFPFSIATNSLLLHKNKIILIGNPISDLNSRKEFFTKLRSL